MSSRGRRGRGRPPKSAVLSHRPSLLKKPRYLYAGSGAQGSRVGLQLRPYDGPAVQPQLRQRLREKSQKVRTFIQSVLGDEEDNDFEAPSSADESDYQRGAEDDDDEERESVASYESDDASVYSQSSYSTISSSTPAKRKWTRRPHSPVFLQEREIPPLALPKSSEDLILPTCHIMRALSIYESLRHFRNILRLTPFRFEDFCVALMSDEQSALLSEAHIALLRAILREEEAAGTQFGPQDLKDSINVHLYMVDAVTWPAVLRMYLGSDPDFRSMLSALERCEYPFTTVASKLNVLEFLCDQFLTTAQAREDITSEGVAKHDDHCRVCHKLGDLLCCETCPAVFHLACLDPPLTDVPTEDWICTVCQANQVSGVTDCISDIEKGGLLSRQECLGLDRHGRKYWFLCRRIFVEGENNEVFYYSTSAQLEELLDVLDPEDLELDLCRTIADFREEITKHMELTEKLTNSSKGNRKTYLDAENDSDADSVLVLTKDGEISRVARGKVGGAVPLNSGSLLFKLGMEGSYRSFTNQYHSNTLALNKHQHAEDRDKRRHLSHKFSLTTASEFKWGGAVHGSRAALVGTLRQTLLQLENSVPAALLHPNWAIHRSNWLRAVNMCTSPRDFSLALAILEASVKPVLFNAAWSDVLGHTRLRRSTAAEREEKKKSEKRERRELMEEEVDRSVWVKYTLGLKHQVWKQKGEEYRITGQGGWLWNSCTRTVRHLPAHTVGLRAGPHKVVISLQGHKDAVKMETGEAAPEPPKEPATREVKITGETLLKAMLASRAMVVELVDVSESLSSPVRTLYPKVARPTKIDGFLDRRMKLKELEDRLAETAAARVKAEPQVAEPSTTMVSSTSKTTAAAAVATATLTSSTSVVKKAMAAAAVTTATAVTKSTTAGDTKTTVTKTVTSNKVYLGKITKVTKKVKKNKGTLPPFCRFQTFVSKQRSIMVLPQHELRKMARRGSLREATGFSYTAKVNPQSWPYGVSPRPCFKTAWRYRNQMLTTIHQVALQLRVLWASLRWDDLQAKSPPGGTNTMTTESDVQTTELLKRKDIGPFGLRSEYLVRRITVPIDLPSKPREKVTPQRTGLRERRRPESPQHKGPSVTEVWVPEEDLELWEIRQFGEKQLDKKIVRSSFKLAHPNASLHMFSLSRIEKQQLAVREKLAQVHAQQSADKIRAQMEQQLKQQRLAMQQKRLQDGGAVGTTPKGTTTKTITVTVSTPQQAAAQGMNKVGPLANPQQIVVRAPVAGQTRPAVLAVRGVLPAGANAVVRPAMASAQPTQGAPVRAQIQIIQGPNGQLQVRGLLPGQQLLRLPDGRLQLLTLPVQTAAATSAATTAATTTSTPTGQQTIQIATLRPALSLAPATSAVSAGPAVATAPTVVAAPQATVAVATPQATVQLVSQPSQIKVRGVTGIKINKINCRRDVSLAQMQPTMVLSTALPVSASGVVTTTATTLAPKLIQIRPQLSTAVQQHLIQQQVKGEPE
ncbi:unnamed protein product [Ixodes persulcatus]